MSIKAMNWTWELDLSPGPKLILLALADAADDFGECWPKMRTVARKCRISERTAQRAMKNFIAAGLIEQRSRFNEEGRQLSNKYRLLIHGVAPDKLSPHVKTSRPKDEQVTSSGATQLCQGGNDSTLSYQEPPNEPKETTFGYSLRFHPQILGAMRERCMALLLGMNAKQSQALLDELGRAIELKSIRTTPEQWLRGAVRIRTRSAGVPRREPGMSKEAYIEAMVRKGIPLEVAIDIANKTVS